jgi:hypothetical protein
VFYARGSRRGREHRHTLRAGAAVAAALVTGLGIAIITDLADWMIDHVVAARFVGAAIRAASVTGDKVAIIAGFFLIEDPIRTVSVYADWLLGGKSHAGWTSEHSCSGSLIRRAARRNQDGCRQHYREYRPERFGLHRITRKKEFG